MFLLGCLSLVVLLPRVSRGPGRWARAGSGCMWPRRTRTFVSFGLERTHAPPPACPLPYLGPALRTTPRLHYVLVLLCIHSHPFNQLLYVYVVCSVVPFRRVRPVTQADRAVILVFLCSRYRESPPCLPPILNDADLVQPPSKTVTVTILGGLSN